MPKRIRVGNQTYVVPDDATDDEITQIVDGGNSTPSNGLPAGATGPLPTPAAHAPAPEMIGDFQHPSAGQFGANVVGHAVDTVKGAAQPFLHPVKQWQTMPGSNKAMQDMGAQASEDWKTLAHDPGRGISGLVGDLAGTAAVTGVLHGAGKIGPKAIAAPKPIADAAGDVVERYKGYDSPVIAPGKKAAARMAAAVRPPGGVTPQFEENLAAQTPALKAYAAESGNPLHSQWEGAQAAKMMADRNLKHYNDNILGPHADAEVPVARGYQGAGRQTPSGMRATLQQINDRIGQINDLTRAAGNAKTGGATMTALEKVGLEGEANGLRQQLYRELGERNGLSPEQVQNLRESYGQLYNISDTIDAARRSRMGRSAATEEGGAGASVPHSHVGILREGIDLLRGGKEYLADRAWRKNLQQFGVEPQELPQPTPREAAVLPPQRAPLYTTMDTSGTVLPTPDFTPDPSAAIDLQSALNNKKAARVAGEERQRHVDIREAGDRKAHGNRMREQARQNAARRDAALVAPRRNK